MLPTDFDQGRPAGGGDICVRGKQTKLIEQ